MTFYNLPETDVTVEYDKDKKMLHIANLPSDSETPLVVQGNKSDGTEEVWVMWGKTSVAGEGNDRRRA